MRFHKYARNAILYTALFSILTSTMPVPIVYAAPAVETGQEQTDDTETTAYKQILEVQTENTRLVNAITDLKQLITEKQNSLPEPDSETDKYHTILYIDYPAYKDTLQEAETVAADATLFTTGDEETDGSTKALEELLLKYPKSDTTTDLTEDDKKRLDSFAKDIQTHIATISKTNENDCLTNLSYNNFSLTYQLELLQRENEVLKTETDAKRIFITEENEKTYTPASYKPFKDTVEEGDREYEEVSAMIDNLNNIILEKNYIEAARNYAITSADDISDIEKHLADIQNQLEHIKTIIEKVKNLNSSSLVKQQTKYALEDAINKAASYPPDIYTTYTADTYSVFQKCLEDAKRVYNDGDATRDQIRAAKEALLAAIDALVEVDRAYMVIGNTYYYNVNAFGAFGTDSEDDTAALQKALDQARTDVNIVITVPAGTYYISDVLYIQSNTTLNLDTNATIYRSDKALSKNMLKNAVRIVENKKVKYKSTGYTGYTLSQNITVNGGTWNGGNINKSTKSTNLIYLGHADNVQVTNTTIKNCHGSHALEFAGVQNGLIRNCNFSGFRYGDDNYTSEAIQLDICYQSGNTEWTPGFSLDKTTCKNITIEYCNIVDYPRGIGSHHVLSGVPYENIKIRNNTITRNSSTSQSKCVSGVFIMGAKNLTIKKNTVNGYSYGIWIKQSSKLTVKKNVLKNNPTYNLVYDGNDVANKYVKFTITKYKVKTKPLKFTAPTIKKGNMKTRGQTYKIKKVKKTHSVTLKKKLKKNQKITFYGMDKDNNKFYRTYYVGK